MPEVIKRQLIADLPDKSRVVAKLELRPHGAPGRLSAAFSLCGEVYYPRANASGKTRHMKGADMDSGGQVHTELLRAFPQLAQFAAMHLSDPETGEPMHALANAWYFYAGSRADVAKRFDPADSVYEWQLIESGLPVSDDGRRQYCYQAACRLLRVSEIPLDEIAAEIEGLPTLKTYFDGFVDDQRERWRQEAAEARAFIMSLPVQRAE